MWICQIDVGQAEPTQIVTGAWNIHVGDLVPVAARQRTSSPTTERTKRNETEGTVRSVGRYGTT